MSSKLVRKAAIKLVAQRVEVFVPEKVFFVGKVWVVKHRTRHFKLANEPRSIKLLDLLCREKFSLH